MCIAVPVKVIEVREEEAVVNLGGVTRRVNIDLVPQVRVGDYVLLHSGCAIKKVNQRAAKRTLQLFELLATKEGKD